MGSADELRRLAADLAKGVDQTKVRAALRKGGSNIKAQLREEAGRSRHFKIASRITFDEMESLGGPAVEVGPTRQGAGRLGVIAYFGGVHGGGGTLPDPQGALDAEAPRFEQALADLAKDIL